jgi:hypothetical protein
MRFKPALLAALLCAACAAIADTKVKASIGVAPAGPEKATVFIARTDDDGQPFPSAFEEGLIAAAAARYSWFSFKVGRDGTAEFSEPGVSSGFLREKSAVKGAPGLYAASIAFPGPGAKGGKAYTVSFGPEDAGFFQPDEWALLKAIAASKKSTGSARVARAAFSKGAFIFVVVLK